MSYTNPCFGIQTEFAVAKLWMTDAQIPERGLGKIVLVAVPGSAH